MTAIIEKKLFNLFREFNRNNQFIADDLGSNLTPAESFILIMVDSLESPEVGDIAKRLNLPSGTVSTTASRMIKKKLLKVKKDAKDARKSLLALTLNGRQRLSLYDQRCNLLADKLFSTINSEEYSIFTKYLHKLADQVAIPFHPKRAIDSDYRQAVRRASVAFKFLSAKFFDSKISSLQWQTLSIIDEGKNCTEDLVESLRIPKATAANTIRSLAKLKMLTTKANLKDNRRYRLEITSSGLRELKDIESRFCKIIAMAIKEFKKDEIQLLLQAFDKVTSNGQTAEIYIDQELALRKDLPTKVIKEWRQLLFKSLDANNLPETLLSPKNVVYGLVKNGVIAGIAEVDCGQIINWLGKDISAKEKSKYLSMLA